jgi:hypothetical protein
LTYGNGPFGIEELLAKPFRNFGGDLEFRTRFLTYLFLTVDHYFRFYLYEIMRIPTILSVSIIFYLISIPLLWRTFTNLGVSRFLTPAVVGVYISSVGYISSFSLMFMPGKALSNFIFTFILYIGSREWRIDHIGAYVNYSKINKLCVSLLIFTGFFVDEMCFFSPFILPIIFSEFFSYKKVIKNTSLLIRNILWYLVPILLFCIFVLYIVPILTDKIWGYQFDFLSSAIGSKKIESDLPITGKLTYISLLNNYITLLSTSFVPWQFDLTMISGDQSIIKIIFIAMISLLIFLLSWKLSDRHTLAQRALILFVFSIVFIAALNGRHAVVVNGYYYGSAFALFFSICLGLIANLLIVNWPRHGMRLAIISIFAIVLIQVNNSVELTARNRDMYRMLALDWFNNKPSDLRPLFGRLDPDLKFSGDQLDAIWKAWHDQDYLRLSKMSISPEAMYLIAELHRMDVRKIGPIQSHITGAERKQR